MALSSRGQIIEEKFLSEDKLRKASVLVGLGKSLFSGTIIGQKFDKTLVLSVAHAFATVPSWMSKTQIEEQLGAYFYDDPEFKCHCKIAFRELKYDILLLVVDKCSTAEDKLIFAPDEERKLQENQFLGCYGHPLGYYWKIETGRVCSPELLNNGDPRVMDCYETDMTYFEHRLDLTVGYSGAGLFNENYNFVGIHTGNPICSYSTMAATRLNDKVEAGIKELTAISEGRRLNMDEGARELEIRRLDEECANALWSLGKEAYKESDAITIKIPKSELKFAIHVKYVEEILRKFLESEYVSIQESLVQALEDHLIISPTAA